MPAKRKRGRPVGTRTTVLRTVPAPLERRLVVAVVKLFEAELLVRTTWAKTGVVIGGLRLESSRPSERPGRTAAIKLAAQFLGVGEETLRSVYYGKRAEKARR